MQQHVDDTNMWYIDTCAIMIDIFYIGRPGVLVNGIHRLEPQQNRLLHRHKDACNSAPLPCLDEDGGKIATRWLSWCFLSSNMLYIDERDKESTTPDCGKSIPATHGGQNDSRLGGASSGIILSPIPQVSICHIKV